MSSTPTIAEIARIAGVGTATVDRVLNRRPGVNVLTVQRVLQAVSEPGTPQQPGRSRKVESLRFAFVLPAEDSPSPRCSTGKVALISGGGSGHEPL